MKKTKNIQLFIAFLILGAVLFLPAVFVKAENSNQADINKNQADINKNQADINKNQADINKNQADINRNQADVNESQDDGDQFDGAEHQSAVATFVQGLLNVADKEKGGIGDQVKAIAKEQEDSKNDVADEIDKIKNRSGLKTFFIGTDYKNVGQLRSEMVKAGNRIDQLKGLLDQAKNAENKTALQTQIQSLEQQQQKINDFLKVNESKFSLFGWFVKLFNK